MRLKALAGIYTMHSFAQLCNLNSLSKFATKLLDGNQRGHGWNLVHARTPRRHDDWDALLGRIP